MINIESQALEFRIRVPGAFGRFGFERALFLGFDPIVLGGWAVSIPTALVWAIVQILVLDDGVRGIMGQVGRYRVHRGTGHQAGRKNQGASIQVHDVVPLLTLHYVRNC